MKLPQIDSVNLQKPQTKLGLLRQVLRPAYGGPFVRSLPRQPALGRNHHALRVRRQRLANQSFAYRRTIRVRRIDEVDAQLHRPPQQLFGVLPTLRLPPYAIARNAHGAKSKAVDLEIPAQLECLLNAHEASDAVHPVGGSGAGSKNPAIRSALATLARPAQEKYLPAAA